MADEVLATRINRKVHYPSVTLVGWPAPSSHHTFRGNELAPAANRATFALERAPAHSNFQNLGGQDHSSSFIRLLYPNAPSRARHLSTGNTPV